VHPWQGMGIWAMTAGDGGIKHKEKVKLYWIIYYKMKNFLPAKRGFEKSY
jgi:hypothetical protein